MSCGVIADSTFLFSLNDILIEYCSVDTMEPEDSDRLTRVTLDLDGQKSTDHLEIPVHVALLLFGEAAGVLH